MSRVNRGNKESGSWIRPEKRLAIYLRDEFVCVYCDRDLGYDYFVAAKREITLDHIVIPRKGGTNESTNLITACRSCNSKRKDQSIYKFTTPDRVAKILRQSKRSLKLPFAKAKYILSTSEGCTFMGVKYV